ncbi:MULTISPECIES: hypothetical protein [Streptococcus]|uniref:hypothetical protein n=1 Tax=Streptococcus TaxID=1301 RepID=UPI00090F70C6|nr:MULTISPECIES: hypothetical protein [Streptococcus]MCW1013022.1 hypothetical protein [Streptococcus anginosus]MCW1091881.1 hypothetical protein [Streptococcus anginosus]MED5831809.1 hypothetical protein [Streptococcus anginosus]MED5941381.1 hypothetical protein [Streptococcus anginosus]MED5943132.1 hypothetical protein [Streptococcus anginosus]
MLATIFGLFGVTDFIEAQRMTVKEFRIRKRGYTMKRLEREQELYVQAYLNRIVKATDRNGKEYIYKKFDDFYDEAKRRNAVLGGSFGTPVNSDLIAIAKRMKEYEKGDY